MSIRTLGLLCIVAALSGPFCGMLRAQGTVAVNSGDPALVPAPTATEYQSTTSLFSGTMVVTGSCGNVGDCTLKVQATSSVLTLEFKILSRSGSSGDCLSTVPANGTITPITTSPTAVGGIKKNKVCAFSIQYQATSLSYTAYPVATYNQPLTFTITSP